MKPQILLLQSAPNNTGVSLPNGQLVALNPAVAVRNSLDAADFSGGLITAKRTGFFNIQVSAEAERVDQFQVVIRSNGNDYVSRGFAPLNSDGNADQRIQRSVSKRLFLNEGETVSCLVKQEGSETATLWPWPDTVFIEVEYLGY